MFEDLMWEYGQLVLMVYERYGVAPLVVAEAILLVIIALSWRRLFPKGGVFSVVNSC